MSNILVVDDDIVIRDLLSDYLNANGFDVLTASSANEALEIAKTTDLKLFLADFQMPDMNGDELLRTVKASHPQLPVVLMSGNSDTQSIVEGQGLKANDYIQKPFSPKEILEVIQKQVS